MDNESGKKDIQMKKMAPLFVLLAGCLWGSMGIFVRGLNVYGFDSMDIVFLRVFGAMLVLGLWMLFFDRKKFRIRRKDIWCFIGTGVISIVFFNYCYFSTIQLTSLSIAAIMLYTAPAIVTILGIFLFKESFRPVKIIALLLAFAGCVLVTGVLTDGAVLTPIGMLLGLGSGFGYAMYSIFGRYATEKGYTSVTISFYTFLFGMAGTCFFVKPFAITEIIRQHPSCMPLVLGLVLFNTLAAYICYTIGLSYMEAGKASILASVEPVVASLIGFLLYKENMDGMTLAGVVLVLVSAVIVNLSPANQKSGEM